MMDSHIGCFEIDESLIRNYPDIVREIMSQVIVV